MVHRVKVLGLLSLPLLALAVALMLFSFGSSSDDAQAAGGGPQMALNVKGGDCDLPSVPTKCDVGAGQSFTLSVDVVAKPAAGYILAQTFIDYGVTGLTYKKDTAANEIVWPDCADATALNGQTGPGFMNHGCLTGLLPPQPKSNFIGNIVEVTMNCPPLPASSHTIDLLAAGPLPAGTDGALFVEPDGVTQDVPKVGSLEVNCTPAPTATPTPTPPPVPRMAKKPALSNNWLNDQGVKIPPQTCLLGNDTTDLTEQINIPIVSADPKNPSAFQQLAAFEFEVHYDETKVCVELIPGPEWTDPLNQVICLIEDSATKPQLEGVARIGCASKGKGHDIDELMALATVRVRPQPEVYSQAKPNQDNGVAVQINDVGCDLADEQGHGIPLFSCEDADITFRYLEGDVDADCDVDVADQQAIAFRWGTEKGSLIYRDFMNLEPSGAQSDADIDIADLQFVFGRHGSSCTLPHPPQDPQNPKA
jgi:hypothetical protein